MPKHKKVPQYFYTIMLDCWNLNPDHRPTFNHLTELMQGLSDTVHLTEKNGLLFDNTGKFKSCGAKAVRQHSIHSV